MADWLAPGLHRLDLGWPAPLGTTAYLVEYGDLTLVDAGFPRNAPSLRAEIADAGHAVTEIDRVLITHYDLDHLGGLSRLAPDLTAPVYLGRADLELLRGDGDPPLLHHKGLFHRGLRAVYGPPETLSYRPVEDGDCIGGFRAFHTPGHNPGHTVYVHGELGGAFLGDLAWGEDGGLTIPVWLDSYDVEEIKESVKWFASVAPNFDLACVAHGPPILEGGDDALNALADGVDAESGWLLC